ncbi:MAG: tetratricopeptide repeat protein [Chitinophagaceae bacterium]|nr:MAG: tetratricopeptide repeat protein [Chitinophagaceae bacterium]
MLFRVCFLLGFLLFFFETDACINGESRVLKDGTVLFEDYFTMDTGIPKGHHFETIARNVGPRLLRRFDETRNYEYLSDYGVVLLLQRKYNEARNLYARIEREAPGRYATASNLGTVYELMGRNDSALHWIRRAVAINPASHDSSEWLHVRILEAKVAGIAEPTVRQLIGTDFGTMQKPQSALSGDSIWKLKSALYYQLNERLSFIKPQDFIIGQLLFAYGDLEELTGRRERSREAYEAAARYGLHDTLLSARLAYVASRGEELAQDAAQETAGTPKARPVLVEGVSHAKETSALPWAAAGALAIAGLSWFAWRRRRS